MKTGGTGTGLLFMCLTVWPAIGVSGGDPAPTTHPDPAQAVEDFWPPPVLVDGLLRRWAGLTAEAVQLTPEQHAKLQAQLLERWPKFLEENRSELRPLLNEYLETRLAKVPPSREKAQAWAQRARPQLEKVRRFLDEGHEQFAPLLTEGQRAAVEADRVRAARHFDALQQQWRSWERGEFRPQEWWDLTRSPGNGGRARPRPGRSSGQTDGPSSSLADAPETRPTSQPVFDPAGEFEAEMVAWDRYVRTFIGQYHLDEGQRLTAESILAEMKARARDHYQRHRLRIAALEELIRFPKLDTPEAEVEAELVRVYGPIDAMFAELESRLRLIPTEAQKRQATTPP